MLGTLLPQSVSVCVCVCVCVHTIHCPLFPLTLASCPQQPVEEYLSSAVNGTTATSALSVSF